jgi:GntR family transcriptional regulator, vanillate catabolism transcriptional regulator
VDETQESSAHIRALLGIRQLILEGALRPGERVSEPALAEKLAVSRTPIRAALIRLNEEGFVEPSSSSGFVVRSFSESDAFDAIQWRGTLEGLAARLAAERGVPPDLLEQMKTIVSRIDEVLAEPSPESDVSPYVRLNDGFHWLLWNGAQSPMVKEAIARLVRLPFAAPNAFTLGQFSLPALRSNLLYANHQHRALVDALENGEGSRAEALAREHSQAAATYLRDVLAGREQDPSSASPSLRLIRKRSGA